jgi:hypothetical protein
MRAVPRDRAIAPQLDVAEVREAVPTQAAEGKCEVPLPAAPRSESLKALGLQALQPARTSRLLSCRPAVGSEKAWRVMARTVYSWTATPGRALFPARLTSAN